jgi:hypothetical protein
LLWLGDFIEDRSNALLQWPRFDEAQGQRRGASGGNYVDMETGESFWVSGVKKNGEDRHWGGSGKVLVEAAAVADYLEAIGTKTLNTSRCEVTHSICRTDVERLSQLANSSGKGWPDDPEAPNPSRAPGGAGSAVRSR